MQIRPVSVEDLAAICQIEAESFTPNEAATPEDLAARIRDLPSTFLVAVREGQVAGFIVAAQASQRYVTDNLFHETWPSAPKGGFLLVTTLAVAHDFREQGIGTALLATLKDVAIAQERDGISLTCHDYLVAYYERNGFKNEGVSASTHGGGTWFDLVWENPEPSVVGIVTNR